MSGETSNPNSLTEVVPPQDVPLEGLFSNILTPGSSLNPTFLLILDGAFATLLLVLIALLVITRWSVHLIFLILIEVCLWASVKWFVSELQQVRLQEDATTEHNGSNATDRKLKVD